MNKIFDVDTKSEFINLSNKWIKEWRTYINSEVSFLNSLVNELYDVQTKHTNLRSFWGLHIILSSARNSSNSTDSVTSGVTEEISIKLATSINLFYPLRLSFFLFSYCFTVPRSYTVTEIMRIPSSYPVRLWNSPIRQNVATLEPTHDIFSTGIFLEQISRWSLPIRLLRSRAVSDSFRLASLISYSPRITSGTPRSQLQSPQRQLSSCYRLLS